MKTHDFARPLVRNQRQIHEPLLGPDIRNVRHPDLVAARQPAAFDQIFEHRQTRVHVRCFRPGRRFSLHQQPRLAQFFKEPVPPHFHARRRQLALDQVIDFSHPKPWLIFSLSPHQFQHQVHIHRLPTPNASTRIIILRRHPRLRADSNHLQCRAGFHRLVRRLPACFFLKASTGWFSCSQATSRKARSSANSTCVSASASLTRRNSCRNRLASSTSWAFSTRIIFPILPLPYRRTHFITVQLPPISYLRLAASAHNVPSSTSRTTCNLKLLL